MSSTAWIIAAVLWWSVGVAGFTYTWTAKYDFTTRDLVTAVMAGVMGPLAWLVGWLTLIRQPWGRLILHQRKSRVTPHFPLGATRRGCAGRPTPPPTP